MRRSHLSELTRLMGSVMCSPPTDVVFNVTFAGTLIEPIGAVFANSGHPVHRISLANLRHPQDLLRAYPHWPASLRSSPTVALLMNDLGGWPRPLTVSLLPYLNSCVSPPVPPVPQNQPTFDVNAKIHIIEEHVIASLRTRYQSWFDGPKELLWQVVLHALFQSEVKLQGEVASVTWDEISSMGLAVLLPLPGHGYRPQVPSMLVRLVAHQASVGAPRSSALTALCQVVALDSCRTFGV